MIRALSKTAAATLGLVLIASAETPKLNVRTAHDGPQEIERKEQVERLARQYDLKKYTLTREVVIDRTAINHSSPVLTLPACLPSTVIEDSLDRRSR